MKLQFLHRKLPQVVVLSLPASVLLQACAPAISAHPLWMENLPKWVHTEGSEKYLYGIGCGYGSLEDAREEAYNNALAEISSRVSEKIFLILSEKVAQRSTSIENSEFQSRENTKIKKSIYKSVSSTLLQESRIVDTWISPNGKKVCLLVAVEKKNVIEAAGKAISLLRLEREVKITEEELLEALSE